jgi:hypothetical protein
MRCLKLVTFIAVWIALAWSVWRLLSQGMAGRGASVPRPFSSPPQSLGVHRQPLPIELHRSAPAHGRPRGAALARFDLPVAYFDFGKSLSLM